MCFNVAPQEPTTTGYAPIEKIPKPDRDHTGAVILPSMSLSKKKLRELTYVER